MDNSLQKTKIKARRATTALASDDVTLYEDITSRNYSDRTSFNVKLQNLGSLNRLTSGSIKCLTADDLSERNLDKYIAMHGDFLSDFGSDEEEEEDLDLLIEAEVSYDQNEKFTPDAITKGIPSLSSDFGTNLDPATTVETKISADEVDLVDIDQPFEITATCKDEDLVDHDSGRSAELIDYTSYMKSSEINIQLLDNSASALKETSSKENEKDEPSAVAPNHSSNSSNFIEMSILDDEFDDLISMNIPSIPPNDIEIGSNFVETIDTIGVSTADPDKFIEIRDTSLATQEAVFQEPIKDLTADELENFFDLPSITQEATQLPSYCEVAADIPDRSDDEDEIEVQGEFEVEVEDEDLDEEEGFVIAFVPSPPPYEALIRTITPLPPNPPSPSLSSIESMEETNLLESKVTDHENDNLPHNSNPHAITESNASLKADPSNRPPSRNNVADLATNVGTKLVEPFVAPKKDVAKSISFDETVAKSIPVPTALPVTSSFETNRNASTDETAVLADVLIPIRLSPTGASSSAGFSSTTAIHGLYSVQEDGAAFLSVATPLPLVRPTHAEAVEAETARLIETLTQEYERDLQQQMRRDAARAEEARRSRSVSYNMQRALWGTRPDQNEPNPLDQTPPASTQAPGSNSNSNSSSTSNTNSTAATRNSNNNYFHRRTSCDFVVKPISPTTASEITRTNVQWNAIIYFAPLRYESRGGVNTISVDRTTDLELAVALESIRPTSTSSILPSLFRSNTSAVPRGRRIPKKLRNSPQGIRPDAISLGTCSSRLKAVRLCEAMTPPRWQKICEVDTCFICKHSFAMLRPAHHCRNCGFLVCPHCSSKTWPSSMLPQTFHNNESYVRVCDCCHYITERFADALRAGNLERAKLVYSTGNINLRTPLSIYITNEYPIHTAAEGGSLEVMKWLLEDRLCPLFDVVTNEKLKTAAGLTALAIAARYGHLELMRYLIQSQDCSVTEITDINIALNGLHVALEGFGVLPFQSRSSPHWLLPGSDIHLDETEDVVLPDSISTNMEVLSMRPQVGSVFNTTSASASNAVAAEATLFAAEDLLKTVRPVSKNVHKELNPVGVEAIRKYFVIELQKRHSENMSRNNEHDSTEASSTARSSTTSRRANQRDNTSSAARRSLFTPHSYIMPYTDEDILPASSSDYADLLASRSFDLPESLDSDNTPAASMGSLYPQTANENSVGGGTSSSNPNSTSPGRGVTTNLANHKNPLQNKGPRLFQGGNRLPAKQSQVSSSSSSSSFSVSSETINGDIEPVTNGESLPFPAVETIADGPGELPPAYDSLASPFQLPTIPSHFPVIDNECSRSYDRNMDSSFADNNPKPSHYGNQQSLSSFALDSDAFLPDYSSGVKLFGPIEVPDVSQKHVIPVQDIDDMSMNASLFFPSEPLDFKIGDRRESRRLLSPLG